MFLDCCLKVFPNFTSYHYELFVVPGKSVNRLLIKVLLGYLVFSDLNVANQGHYNISQHLRDLLFLLQILVLHLQLIFYLFRSPFHANRLDRHLSCSSAANAFDIGLYLLLDFFGFISITFDGFDELCESPGIPFLVFDKVIEKPIRIGLERLGHQFLVLLISVSLVACIDEILWLSVAGHDGLFIALCCFEELD